MSVKGRTSVGSKKIKHLAHDAGWVSRLVLKDAYRCEISTSIKKYINMHNSFFLYLMKLSINMFNIESLIYNLSD